MLELDKAETVVQTAIDTPKIADKVETNAISGSEIVATTESSSVTASATPAEDDFDESELHSNEPPRKLPPWAIWVAVVSFVIFNLFFLCFAMQMGTGSSVPMD